MKSLITNLLVAPELRERCERAKASKNQDSSTSRTNEFSVFLVLAKEKKYLLAP